MGKNMPAGKTARFSAEMAAHLMDSSTNSAQEGINGCANVASTSEIRMDRQLIDTIRRDRIGTHRTSESSDQSSSIYPPGGGGGGAFGERRETQVKLKGHDRKKCPESVIVIDNRNEQGQWTNMGFLKVGSVIRLHLEETFLLVIDRFMSSQEYFGILPTRASVSYISIAHDFLPNDLSRLVQNADKAHLQIRLEHLLPMQLSGKDGAQLDNVQLYFRELYLSRADMWKMRKALIGKALFQDRDMVSSVLNVNLRISDMWSKGQEVKHGYVSPDTRVVFRSSSSMVLIYIQVSEEMFHMDETGHMLFETCTFGFLNSLLSQWQRSMCSHYVSIIMCSRWFFKKLPSVEAMAKGKLVPDQRGRYYQDFYKLLVQNEHYEDWMTAFSKILHPFYDYREIITEELCQAFDLPADNFEISVADDANFLPSLNMSMNMFCMYHNDRRYETTGQQIIYVTPGSGVFNVDESAVQPTKQRLIDMGISLDMVCLGEQPLHVTPLFMFHNSSSQVYKYYIPHWMNYSYYRMESRPRLFTFNPRVILPHDYLAAAEKLSMVEEEEMVECEENGENDMSDGVDRTKAHMARLLDAARRKLNGESTDTETDREEHASSRASAGSSLCSLDDTNEEVDGFDPMKYGSHRRTSDLDLEPANEKTQLEEDMCSTDRTTFMQLIERVSPVNSTIQNASELLEKELFPNTAPTSSQNLNPQKTLSIHRFSSISGVPQQRERSIGASSLEGTGVTFDLRRGGSSLESGRGRVSSMMRPNQAYSYHQTAQMRRQSNAHPDFPFKPDSHVVMTANRRRWIHVFPMDERGMSKSAHHYVQGRSIVNVVDAVEEPPSSSHRQIPIQGAQNESPLRRAASPQAGGIHQGSPGRVTAASPLETVTQSGPRAWAWAWGSTGEEKWNPDIIIDMDWKSLIRSALLPITTDFFPEGFTIRNQYLVHGHQVLVDYSLIEDIPSAKSLTLSELSRLVFDLLISQRLQRGFQIVTLKRALIKSSIQKAGRFPQDEGVVDDDVTLTFSNIYHRLVRKRNDIYVTLFIPDPNGKQYEVAKPGESRSSRKSGNNAVSEAKPSTNHKERTFEYTQYQYYFQVPDAKRYEKSTTSFKPHNLDKLNWSLLDTKLTYRSKDELKGYSQLFKEEMKSYSSRFMLVFQSIDPDRAAKMVNDELPGETFRQRQPSQKVIYSDFTKFLLSLNKLLYSRRETESGDLMAPSLTVANPEQVLNRFLEKCPYVPLQSSAQNITLPNNYFLSIDLINWLMENVGQLTTREKAIEFVNNEPMINSFRCPPGESDDVDSCRSLDTEKRFIRYGFQLCSIANKNSDPTDQPPPPVRYMKVDYVTHCENYSSKDECCYTPGAFDLELTPRGTVDEGHVLGEWCRVVYDKGFSEDKAFEMTIKWFLASGVTVGEAIRGWVTKADQHHFNLFPVPEDAFAMPRDVHSNPLRCPIRIEVVKGVLSPEQLGRTLIKLLAAFGFVPMYCARHGTPNLQRSYEVVHECGGMFVSIEAPPVDVGLGRDGRGEEARSPLIFWSWNHMLSHRYRTASLKETMEEFQDYMLREFRAVCQNENGRLLKFYEKLCIEEVGGGGIL